ncbi:MAG: hypothetical protein ACRD3W_21860, partial [Terriglobales bacterium]
NALAAAYGFNQLFSEGKWRAYSPFLAATFSACIFSFARIWPVVTCVKTLSLWLLVAALLWCCKKLPAYRARIACASVLLVLPAAHFLNTARINAGSNYLGREIATLNRFESALPPDEPLISMRSVMPFRMPATATPMLDEDLIGFIGAKKVEDQYLAAIAQGKCHYVLAHDLYRKHFPTLFRMLDSSSERIASDGPMACYHLRPLR